MKADSMAQKLAGGATVRHERDGLWVEVPLTVVPQMAQVMLEAEARLATITAKPGKEPGALEMLYHWDLDGELLTVRVATDGAARSIVNVWPAADWVEREIHDYYGTEFEGRDETPPLMLREGDRPGLFAKTCEVGHGADPAYTSKTGKETR